MTAPPEVATRVTDLPAPWCDEPYLRMSYGRSIVERAWPAGDAVLVRLHDAGRPPGLVGLGAVAGVARLLERAVAEDAAAGVGADGVGAAGEGAPPETVGGPVAGGATWATVPHGAWDAVRPEVRERFAGWSAPSAWDCMWTYRPLTGVGGHAVERLPAADAGVAAEVAEALARAHPTASTHPDDPRLTGWWVSRSAGRIVALVGALRLGPGLAPHLASLGVDPEHRGRGLAGAVLGAAVRDCLAEPVDVGPRAVWLGLYASNDVARRVYLRHGFALGHELESRGARR